MLNQTVVEESVEKQLPQIPEKTFHPPTNNTQNQQTISSGPEIVAVSTTSEVISIASNQSNNKSDPNDDKEMSVEDVSMDIGDAAMVGQDDGTNGEEQGQENGLVEDIKNNEVLTDNTRIVSNIWYYVLCNCV